MDPAGETAGGVVDVGGGDGEAHAPGVVPDPAGSSEAGRPGEAHPEERTRAAVLVEADGPAVEAGNRPAG
jgi:hypothetical protein